MGKPSGVNALRRSLALCSVLLALLPLAGPAQSRPPIPDVVWEAMTRFGVRGFEDEVKFNTRDYPDQRLMAGLYDGYSATSQTVRLQVDGDRVEVYVDPHRSRVMDVQGAPVPIENLVRGEEVVVSCTSKGDRASAAALLRPGPLPALGPKLPLDPVPVTMPVEGGLFRGPHGWSGRPGPRNVRLVFMPRVNRTRLVPGLLILRDSGDPTSGSARSRTAEPLLLAQGEWQVGSKTIREQIAGFQLLDNVMLMDLLEVPGPEGRSTWFLGYSLAEEFRTHLPAFRSVAQEYAGG